MTRLKEAVLVLSALTTVLAFLILVHQYSASTLGNWLKNIPWLPSEPTLRLILGSVVLLLPWVAIWRVIVLERDRRRVAAELHRTVTGLETRLLKTINDTGSTWNDQLRQLREAVRGDDDERTKKFQEWLDGQARQVSAFFEARLTNLTSEAENI